MHKFCEKKLQIFCKQPVKGNLHIFSFSWLKIRLFKILETFLHIWNGMVKGFSKMYIFISYHFLDVFCKQIYYFTEFRQKKFQFFQICNLFAISKVKHICHIWTSNMGFKGGVVNWPHPMHILVFNYPSLDRVKTWKIQTFFAWNILVYFPLKSRN